MKFLSIRLTFVGLLILGCNAEPADDSGQHTLEVVVSGSGLVTSLPSGINCGTECTAEFPDGGRVDLIATPNANFIFIEWTNDCTGRDGCSVSMTRDRLVTAVFSRTEPIILAADASAAEQTAARELAFYLEKITGQQFEIIPEDTDAGRRPAFFVGPTTVAIREGLVLDEDNPDQAEAWFIKSTSDGLILFGGRPRGTLYAVYHYLEDELGVHWWTPWEESIPLEPSIPLESIDRSGRPAFRYREVFAELFNEDNQALAFYARNRLNAEMAFNWSMTLVPDQGWSLGWPETWGGSISFGPPKFVHTFKHYFPAEKYNDPDSEHYHPDYYASTASGERTTDQLNLTHPDVLTLAIERLRGYIVDSFSVADNEECSPPVFFSFSRNDNTVIDQTPEALEMANRVGQSGMLLWFINQMASAIEAEYPEALVSTLIYGPTLSPPQPDPAYDTDPRENVMIHFGAVYADLSKPITHPNNSLVKEALMAWSEITTNLAIWEYGTTYGPGCKWFSLNQGLPWANVFNLAENYRYYHSLGIMGIFVEFEYPLTGHIKPLEFWVRAKLLEDPDLEPEALIDQFAQGYYGPAGVYVRQYLDLLKEAEKTSPVYLHYSQSTSSCRYLGLDFTLAAHDLFDQAEQALALNEDLLRRVRHARVSLDRATLLRWRTIVTEHIQAGGSLESFPLDRQAIFDRVHASMLVMYDRIWPASTEEADYTYYWSLRNTRCGNNRDALLDSLKNIEYLPLPERFIDFAPGQVVDYTVDELHGLGCGSSKFLLIDDPQSQSGRFAHLSLSDLEDQKEYYIVTPDRPCYAKLYNQREMQFKLSSLNGIQAQDITHNDYHIYQLGTAPIDPGTYLILFWLWDIRVDLEKARQAGPHQLYDFYASIKFDGPSFPHGMGAEDTISLDRIFVVRHFPYGSNLTVWRRQAGLGYWLVQGQSEVSWGLDTDIPVPADYDGDSKTDIVVWRPSDGKWYIYIDQNEHEVTDALGEAGDIPVPGDYDGNGTADRAVWSPTDGLWTIETGQTFQWGADGDLPVPGNYDGTGGQEPAVWHLQAGLGYWRVIGQPDVEWGLDDDIPVPGDYDGNGTTDIAVWRPSNGHWYIKDQGEYQWGTAGDIPVPGDYDGNGTTDIAVWRPSTGTWYLREMGDYKWGLAGDVPLPNCYF